MENCTHRDGDCDLECLPEHHTAKCGTMNDFDASSKITGIQRLRNKKYNKGLGFTIEERQFLGIHGLLPPVVRTKEQQIQHCIILLNRLSKNIDKYMYLMSLAERSERLFYQLLRSNIIKYLPLIYTPTVGEACLKFGMVYQYPKGLFISIKDKGHIYDILCCWPEKHIRVIVFTDGERILGLGDLGAYGMGVVIGKTILYTAIGGIKPEHCLPVMLDCGTNTNNLIIDPLYIGIREHRNRGKCYDEFIDEFMQAAVRRYGRKCLMHFEDFGNQNAFRFLNKYRQDFCTFNDDIQGTASTVLSGILVAMKVTKQSLLSQTIFFFGAGEACIGIAKLFKYAIMRNGVCKRDVKKLIWLYDTKGLVVKDRPAGGLTSVKLEFAQDCDPIDNLLEAIETACPNILIGATAESGAFTPHVLRLMAKINQRPIIFALSNPTQKAECTAKDAYTYTNGRCLFASGSPFLPFDYAQKRYFPGQSNNLQIYPGVALGVICSGMRKITDEVFLIAAETLSELVTSEEIAKGLLYPSLTRYMCNSVEIARWVMEYAYRFNLATVFPEPKNKHEFIKSQLYDPNFPAVIPEVYLNNEIW